MLESILVVVSIVVGTTVIVGGILSLWLKANLQDLVTAVTVLNNTVNHFIKGQESLKEQLVKQEEMILRNREKIIVLESKITAAHDRIDNLKK